MATHIDIETRSGLDLRKVGVHRYAEDPSTEILIEETEGRGLPWKAHNAMFERVMLNTQGWMLTPDEMSCTLARAAAMSLPLSLGDCAKALKSPDGKDEVGHRLMLKMCKAAYVPKAGEMDRLRVYCAADVQAETALDVLLPELTPSERQTWILDQTINDRGFKIDVPLVDAAQRSVDQALQAANRQMFQLTGGAVGRVTETGKIVAWLNARGVPAESIGKGEQEELLARCDLFADPVARQVVELRRESSRALKFKAMLACVCKDGRIRGTLQYHGAISGRWTGRLVQPQNFKRVETEDDEDAVRAAISNLHADRIVWSLDTLSMLARACIVAPKGKKLMGGDFANIEGRKSAWINGEDWKTEAFRAYDAGAGPDLYKVMAASILDKPVENIAKDDRQLWGKVPELACGYQGGYRAFHKMGNNYGVSVGDTLAKKIVAGWRERNPAICAGWADLQNSAIAACEGRGSVVRCLAGRASYVHDRGFLFCKLPSGRVIAYPGARVERKHKVVIIDGDEVEFDNWGVSFFGQKAGAFRKLDLYGGMQMAHVVSGSSRDILVGAMHRLEAAGYDLILTVHDETLSEVDDGFGSVAEYLSLMEQREPWFGDMPLTAKAWEGYAYDK